MKEIKSIKAFFTWAVWFPHTQLGWKVRLISCLRIRQARPMLNFKNRIYDFSKVCCDWWPVFSFFRNVRHKIYPVCTCVGLYSKLIIKANLIF
jgi:hypothetical protein